MSSQWNSVPADYEQLDAQAAERLPSHLRQLVIEAPPNVGVGYVDGGRALAGYLWDFGEDDLIDTALGLSEFDLYVIERIATVYNDPSYPLPVEGRSITNAHVGALALITYVEGGLRSLKRNRRRPQKDRPVFVESG